MDTTEITKLIVEVLDGGLAQLHEAGDKALLAAFDPDIFRHGRNEENEGKFR